MDLGMKGIEGKEKNMEKEYILIVGECELIVIGLKEKG